MRHVTTRGLLTCLAVTVCYNVGYALEPNEVLVVANGDLAASVRLARYYCQQRGVPPDNVITVPLGIQLRDSISRSDYDTRLAGPIREALLGREGNGKIKCLVTTYGVPFKVGRRGPIDGMEGRLRELRGLADRQKEAIAELKQKGRTDSAEHKKRTRHLEQLKMEIDRITGRETGAAVDSELSLVTFGSYELYRWQPNLLRKTALGFGPPTMMVGRIDGPDYATAKSLVDKAMTAEQNGLVGNVYVDSRGLFTKDLYGYFDQSLRDLVLLARLRSGMPVTHERTPELFAPGACPDTALYCGWYSLQKYVDAFDFVDGAIGFHIASFEARNLRDPNSTQWCPAMLVDGIAATLGPVSEPYLHAFPEPKAFFVELFNGKTLVEAYCLSKPFNSWQLMLIGDPLYTPFGKR